MSSKTILEINNLNFSYGENKILKDINLVVKERESLAIIGPSGCGKTTLLQMIAGDLQPTSGTILKKGLWRRVFQANGLLPWLTVEQNIRMGLRGINERESLSFEKLIHVLDLERVLKLYPRQLSGGLAQRTELARVLIGRPDGLLLDEPFSSLDYLIRHETRNYLNELLKEFPITMLLVTHDIPEAVSFTQRSIIINQRPGILVKEYQNHENKQDLIETIWNDLKFKEDS